MRMTVMTTTRAKPWVRQWKSPTVCLSLLIVFMAYYDVATTSVILMQVVSNEQRLAIRSASRNNTSNLQSDAAMIVNDITKHKTASTDEEHQPFVIMMTNPSNNKDHPIHGLSSPNSAKINTISEDTRTKNRTKSEEQEIPTTVRIPAETNETDANFFSWKLRIAEWINNRTMMGGTKRIVPPNTPGAFVHIGKTGGSTLGTLLVNGCHSWAPKPCKEVPDESYISKLTTYYHTPDYRKLNETNYYFYVITIRDPLSRLLSAFTYMHPANRKFETGKDCNNPFYDPCFPTMESFATAIGDERNDPLEYVRPIWNETAIQNFSEYCGNLARAAMANQVPEVEHLHLNTNAFVRQCKSYPHTAVLLAIRTEFLWHDWVSANEWLGQPPPIQTYKYRVGRGQVVGRRKLPPVRKDITTVGRRRLCRALIPEYQMYFQVLRHAVNLKDEQRRRSFAIYEKHCPWFNITLNDVFPHFNVV